MTWSMSLRGKRDDVAKRVEEMDVQGHGDFDAELAQIRRAKATIVEEVRSYDAEACAQVSAFGYVSRGGGSRNLQINVSPAVAGGHSPGPLDAPVTTTVRKILALAPEIADAAADRSDDKDEE